MYILRIFRNRLPLHNLHQTYTVVGTDRLIDNTEKYYSCEEIMSGKKINCNQFYNISKILSRKTRKLQSFMINRKTNVYLNA